MPGPEPLIGWRVVARPSALDGVDLPPRTLRLAPDEVLVWDDSREAWADAVLELDPYALVEVETGFVVWSMSRSRAADWLAREADWPLPVADGFSQGMAAGLPVKVLTEGETVYIVTRASLASALEQAAT